MTKIVTQLRGELDRDRVEKLDCLNVLRTLTDSMKAYQNGAGPAPLVKDFENWKSLVGTLQRRADAASYVV